MCGRYADFVASQDMADLLDLAIKAGDARLLPPRYNIGPTQDVHIVRFDADEARRELEVARWGLIPTWAKDPSIGSKMFNARVETIAEKPSFRSAFAKRRCLVPASGYYEWRKDGPAKTPFFIHPQDSPVLVFAGLYELWKDRTDADAPWVVSCTIVTTAARDEMATIHDRQPVMLTPEMWDVWLDPDAHPDDLFAAAAADAPHLTWHQVAKDVGNIRNQGEHLVEAV